MTNKKLIWMEENNMWPRQRKPSERRTKWRKHIKHERERQKYDVKKRWSRRMTGGQEEEEGGLHLLTVASPEALRRLRSEVEVMDLKEVFSLGSGSALPLFLS